MPVINLTKRTIDAIPFEASGQKIYRDAEQAGLALRVGKRTKTFIFEGRNGTRNVRHTLGTYPLIGPEKARRQALIVAAELAAGLDPNRRADPDHIVTVAQGFEAMFAAKKELRPKTIENYRRTIDLYLAAWRALPLAEITRQMVLKEHRRITDRHGAVTANNVMRHLRLVYNLVSATRDDYPPNPVHVLTKTRTWAPERRRRRIIAAHQLPAWLRAVQEEGELGRDFLLMALMTGMRRSELTHLRWEHVDFAGRALHLPRTKNGDPLSLPLSPFIQQMLEARHQRRGASPWVFPGPGRTGHLAETKSFTRRVAQRSGVPFALHDLRRTFISIAESLDIPAYALKRLLNHRAQGDVTGGYIVIDVERLRGPVCAITKRILNLAEQH